MILVGVAVVLLLLGGATAAVGGLAAIVHVIRYNLVNRARSRYLAGRYLVDDVAQRPTIDGKP